MHVLDDEHASPQYPALHLAVCGPARGPLLCLLSVVLRLRPHDLSGGAARQELVCRIARQGVFTATSVLQLPGTVEGRGVARGFLFALLGSKALHAASRQLAALVDSVEAAAVDIEAAGEEPAANLHLQRYTCGLRIMVHTSINTACTIAMTSSPDEGRGLCAELVAVLEDSWLVAGARGEGDGGEDAARLAARLQVVASGRCVQHAARCMGLAVLCDADGGSAYGLPPEVLALLHTEQSPAGGEMSEDAATQLRAMVCMMQLGDAAPPVRRGALVLAMRVGWLAVASAQSRAAREGGVGGNDDAASGSSGVSPPAAMAAPGPRRSVPQEEVFPLAADALRAAWRFLALPRAVAQAASAAAVAEAADWWRLAAAVVDRAVPCSAGDAGMLGLASLGSSLAAVWGLLPGCGVLSLPAEPPPALAAALDGGLLCCLELLLRRAGRDPQGSEATLLQGLGRRVFGNCQSFWSYLVPLLAYGEPRQAAALLATMRKVLRTVDSRALESDENEAGEPNSHDGLFLLFTGAPACFFTAVRAQEEEAVAAAVAPGAEPPSPASQQLLILMSCAACEWLPELSQSLSQLLLSNRMASPALLSVLLMWLPLLAGRCGLQQPCATADRSLLGDDAGDGASGSGEAAGDGGWRALLIEEMGAVPLLDASLRMVPRAAELQPESRVPLLRSSLVAACCAVAAVSMTRGKPP
ncbi:hypothetical protein GPECTOR_29g85 [Gonium pectorale]|uniref:Uncharacterized protein n=1 Tax=Gonium pectorale TaxID=33097 RepID=A0A150GG49_GONPE|nr:hypothetical protein GPECTOR_29g85 [Gonium pectorale]|eukprot:KXZ48310.1 hypothetical protein GPECTOR_29g85 [Gonium pectorale]